MPRHDRLFQALSLTFELFPPVRWEGYSCPLPRLKVIPLCPLACESLTLLQWNRYGIHECLRCFGELFRLCGRITTEFRTQRPARLSAYLFRGSPFNWGPPVRRVGVLFRHSHMGGAVRRRTPIHFEISGIWAILLVNDLNFNGKFTLPVSGKLIIRGRFGGFGCACSGRAETAISGNATMVRRRQSAGARHRCIRKV